MLHFFGSQLFMNKIPEWYSLGQKLSQMSIETVNIQVPLQVRETSFLLLKFFYF